VAGARLIGVWAAVALALLVMLAGAGGAGAATQPFPPGLWAFELPATHGYSVGVLAGSELATSDGEVQIEVFGGGRDRVTYRAPATVSETALDADLGSLGRIALRAERSGLERRFQPRCDTPPYRYEPVTYVGEVEFRGEEGYVDATASRLPLLVKPVVESQCLIYGEIHVGGEGAAGAGLHIGSRRGAPRVQVSARTNGPGKVVELSASITERRGEIEIHRSIGRRLPHSVFSYDEDLSAAVLDPPAPFSGRGVFRRNAARAMRWSGDLQVDFPGRSNVPVTGIRFRTKLQRGEWRYDVSRQRPRLAAPTLPQWPSTKPSPTASATSSPLGRS
jgi:hypothetical protein